MNQKAISRKIWHVGSDDGVFDTYFYSEEKARQYAMEKITSFYGELESDWTEFFWLYEVVVNE